MVLSDREKAKQMCDNFEHDWQEEYYGYKCKNCKTFIPYGCEPWMPFDDDDDDDFYHSETCTCETCIQNYPERMIYLDDEEDEGPRSPTLRGDGQRVSSVKQTFYKRKEVRQWHQMNFLPKN